MLKSSNIMRIEFNVAILPCQCAFLAYFDVNLKFFSNKTIFRVGLDFLHWELIGSLEGCGLLLLLFIIMPVLISWWL